MIPRTGSGEHLLSTSTPVCVHVFVLACVHTWLEGMTNRDLEESKKPTRWCQCHLLTCRLLLSRSLTPTLTLQFFLFYIWLFVSSPWYSSSYILSLFRCIFATDVKLICLFLYCSLWLNPTFLILVVVSFPLSQCKYYRLNDNGFCKFQ